VSKPDSIADIKADVFAMLGYVPRVCEHCGESERGHDDEACAGKREADRDRDDDEREWARERGV